MATLTHTAISRVYGGAHGGDHGVDYGLITVVCAMLLFAHCRGEVPAIQVDNLDFVPYGSQTPHRNSTQVCAEPFRVWVRVDD